MKRFILPIVILFPFWTKSSDCCLNKTQSVELQSLASEILQKTNNSSIENNFRVLRTSTVKLNVRTSTPATHQMPLTVVIFKDSLWTIPLVENRLKLTAQYLSQCGIRIERVTIFEAEAPKAWIENVPMPHGKRTKEPQLEFVEHLKGSKKPLIFYIGRTSDGVVGYARTEKDAGKVGDSSIDTVWISAEALSQSYIKDRGAGFITEAHELGHLLGDWIGEGHVLDPENIMSATGTKFNKSQCDVYRASELVEKIKHGK